MARILIVDDEPLIAEIAVEWLAEMGHAVVGPAYDLKTALSLADGDLDAAILDVSLGRNDSYPVADRLKARGAPFAFATGYGLDPSDPRRRGVPQLPKPFDFETFRAVVEALLSSTASEASRSA